MIKKSMLILILLMPLVVFGEEIIEFRKDNYYIEDAYYEIAYLIDNKFEVEENYKTRLIYGDTSQTYFFEKTIDNSFSFNYKGLDYKYNVEHKINNIEGDSLYSIDQSNKDSLRYVFGEKYSLLKEIEYFKIKYTMDNFALKNNMYAYKIGNDFYEIKKLTFKIIAPFATEGKEILFSLDGKNFSKEIDGLSVKLEGSAKINGEYNKTLNKGEEIYFLMYDSNEVIFEVEKEKTNNNNLYLIIGGVVVLVGLSAFLIVKKVKDKK